MAIKFLNTVQVDTDVLYVNTTNNNVGVGTDNPLSTLHIAGPSTLATQGTVLKIENTADQGSSQDIHIYNQYDRDIGIKFETLGGTNYIWQDSNSDDSLILSSGGTNRTNDATLIINQSHNVFVPNGKVGIGMTSADNLLTLQSSGDTILQINRKDDTIAGGNRTGIIQFGAKGSWGTNLQTSKIWSYAEETFTSTANGTSLRFFTTELGAATPNEKMIIDTNGNVGIGTDNPAQKFVVANATNGQGIEIVPGTSGIIQSYDRGTSAYIPLYLDTSLLGLRSTGYIALNTGSGFSEAMRIDSSGNVGIGTTSPGAKLVVTDNADGQDTTFRVNHTRSDSNVATQAIEVDMNLSGADTTTGDKSNSGVRVDVDSTANGDASDEHRIYGVYSTVNFTGFTDLARGGYFLAESNYTSAKTQQLAGVYGQATHDSNNTSGGVSNMMGVYGISVVEDLGDVDNAFGGYFQVELGNNRGAANFGITKGVEGHININKETAVSYDSMTAVSAVIDNNEGSTPNFGNQFLFKGDYQGDKGNDAYGIYCEGDKHYLTGNLGVGVANPTQVLHVVGNARVTGAYYDSNNSSGAANQVLVSTETGTDWVDGSGSSIIGGPYLPLTAGSSYPLTGNLILDDGSGSSPSIVFKNANDDTWSIFNGSQGVLNITEGTTDRLQFAAGGNATFAGNVLLGDDKELIFGAATDYKIYHNSTTNVNHISSLIDRQLSLNANNIFLTNQANDSTFLQLSSTGATFAGDVTIGNSNSSATTLNLVKSTSGVSEIKFLNATNEKASIQLDAAEDLQIFSNTSQQIKLRSGGADTLTLDASQNATFTGLVSGITPTAAANFVTKAYADGLTPGAGVFLPLAGNTTATAMTGDIFLANTQQVRFLTSANTIGLRMQSSGTNSFIDNEVGDMYIRQEADGNDMIFQADAGSGGNATYFKLDASLVNGTTTLGAVNFPDKSKLFFGNDSDLRIYHDASNSYIETSTSSAGDLYIKAQGTNHDLYLQAVDDIFIRPQGGENGIYVQGNGGVALYHDNSVKFETTSTGITVTGDIQIDSALLSNQENTDIDSAAAEMVAQVAIATYTAAFFDFVVKKSTNVRSGTVYACHDGTNVEFTETSTQDLGNTSDVVLSVDISGGNMRLMATVASDDWSVKSLIRAI